MGGKDYYQQLAPYLISISFEDNCDAKKADDLEIKLADRDKRFISDWMPKKGAYLDVSIIAERWFSPIGGTIKLDCGRFWIDSVEFSLPDHSVSIKGTSIPTGIRLKASVENRGWEGATLKDIATQIAGENQMTLEYNADVNPKYTRTEQHDQSALGFLMKRANNAKLAVKVHKNKIIIYDEQKMEQEEPKIAILYGNVSAQGGMAAYRMESGTFTTTVVDKTKKAKVKRVDTESGETQEGEAEEEDEEDDASTEASGGDNGEGGSGDTEEEDTGSIRDPDDVVPPIIDQNISEDTDEEPGKEKLPEAREAEEGSDANYNASESRKAGSVVRDKNKHKDVGKITLSIGNPLIAAGMTMTLKGVGQYDGKWFIESAHHEVGPQYNTELSIRRCLKGV